MEMTDPIAPSDPSIPKASMHYPFANKRGRSSVVDELQEATPRRRTPDHAKCPKTKEY